MAICDIVKNAAALVNAASREIGEKNDEEALRRMILLRDNLRIELKNVQINDRGKADEENEGHELDEYQGYQ